MTSTEGGQESTPGTITLGSSVPDTFLEPLLEPGTSSIAASVYWELTTASTRLVTVTATSTRPMIYLYALRISDNGWLAIDDNYVYSLSEFTGDASITFSAMAGETYQILVETGLYSEPFTFITSEDYLSLDVVDVAVPDPVTGSGAASWDDAPLVTSGTVTLPVTYQAHMLEGTERPYWPAWWKFLVEQDTVITIDTVSSLGDLYADSYIKVFTGSTYEDRVLVAENDDIGYDQPSTLRNYRSRVTFLAYAGETYHVAVGSWGPSSSIIWKYDVNVAWETPTRGKRISAPLELSAGNGHTRPYPGSNLLYTKSDDRLYLKSSSGVETKLGPVETSFTFTHMGPVEIVWGIDAVTPRLPIPTGQYDLVDIRMSVTKSPVGSALEANIVLDSYFILATSKIFPGETQSSFNNVANVQFHLTEADSLRVWVNDVGSTTPAEDMVIVVTLRKLS